MIPKIIHYCWFGGKDLPKLEKRCLESWSRILPDFTIKRWDESNFPIEDYPFAKDAYAKKKYAFVADVARLHALFYEGGIYLDTDVEVIKSLDDFLKYNLVMGFETDNVIQTGVICACKSNRTIKNMLDYYATLSEFDPASGGDVANSALFADMFRQIGINLQNRNFFSEELVLFSSEYFCPINQATWEISPTNNTYCIHYLSGSWLPKKDRISRKLKSLIGKYLGFGFVAKLRSYFK